MTDESPVKVFSLLGASLFSMFLLFAVSATNASFTRLETPLPDIMGPEKVVGFLDNVSSSYSEFLTTNLLKPAGQSLAFYTDNINFIVEEAGPVVAPYLGIRTNTDEQVVAATQTGRGEVAGAYIKTPEVEYPFINEGINMDTLYNLLQIN